MGINSNDHQMIICNILDVRYSVWFEINIVKIILLQWRRRLKVNWSSLKRFFFSRNCYLWSWIFLCCKRIMKIFSLLKLKYIFTLCKAKIVSKSSYAKKVKDIFSRQSLNIVQEIFLLKVCEWVIKQFTINWTIFESFSDINSIELWCKFISCQTSITGFDKFLNTHLNLGFWIPASVTYIVK